MDLPIIAVLFGLTAAAVLVWAIASKRATEAKLDDPKAKKSTLAKDGPDR